MYSVSSFIRHGLLGLAVVAGTSGCGSSSDGNDVSVVSIAADSRVISVGAGTVLAIDITFDSSRVAGGDNFNAVLRLPVELRYREGSAEVDGFTSEDDNSKSPIVVNCNEGEQYLSFEFSQSDLVRARNPSGNGDMRLNLTVDGVVSAANAVIEAAAEEDVPPFACGNVFVADLAESIQIQ
jgi:hypothetical protein